MEKFDFNDVLIRPKKTSKIRNRSEINPFYGKFLPLITAPMDTVISSDNVYEFKYNKITPCLVRGEGWFPDEFQSFSLNEMRRMLGYKEIIPNGKYLIDIANGHMEEMLEITKEIKKVYPKLTLMVGNVANPHTYVELSEAGADYVRIGIGNGNACSTTVHTGVGYPMGSLVQECYELSMTLNNPAKIVADGGMKSYSDIIKALALGADYVMLGSILNKSLESAGDNYLWKFLKVSQSLATRAYKIGIPVYKKFRGMSTKEVQKKWGNEKLKTSEGVIRFRKVEYTLPQWVENFEHYLRSAMSYSDAKNLSEFIGNAGIIKISDNSFRRFDK